MALIDNALLVYLPYECQPNTFKDGIGEAMAGEGKYLVAERDGIPVAHASLSPMTLNRLAQIGRLNMCVRAGYGARRIRCQ